MASTVLSAAERIESKFGGKWEKAGEGILKPPASVSTGSLLMDEAIGDCKGFPEGSVIEVYGPQHSGKTLMGYLAIASSQRKNPKRDHLIIDAENQFRFQSRWAKQVGVDVPNLYVKPVTSGEEAFDIMEMAILGEVELNSDGEVKKVIEPGNFGVILVDSVSQLVPLEMIHKGNDQSNRMAVVAAMMSKGLKKVLSAMVVANSKTIIMFINQIRMNPQAKYGCLHSFTRIHTATKDYKMNTFVRNKINEKVLTYNEKKDEFEEQEPVSHFNNGLAKKEDFIKICFQTPSNRKFQQLVCTKNHNVMTKDGWKEAQNLTKDDYLVGFCDNLLSKNQEQILLGSMLGDGFLHKSTLKSSLRLENSEQPKYLKWKVDQLKCLNFKQTKCRYDSEYNLFLKNYFDLFYENDFSKELKQKTGRLYRTFSQEVFEKLDILGLAILYLDDGSLVDSWDRNDFCMHIGSKRFRHLEKCYFFEILLKSFKKFGLKGKKLNNGYCIELTKESSFKFSNMIKQFVIPEMQYKLFSEHRNCYDKKSFESEKQSIGREKYYVKVLKTGPMMKKESIKLLKYDIETPNHTYLVGSSREFSGVIVHNSNPESRTGGMALPFYNTISFRVSKVFKTEERDERGKIFAHQAKIKFDKNKAGGLPADPIIIRICYDGTGIDQNSELMSVAEINGLVKEFKRARYNFVKPGTDELFDESIDYFKKDDFKSVLEKHPEVKKMILQFIQEGKFYTLKEIVEDNPDADEAGFGIKLKEPETTTIVAEKVEGVEKETIGVVEKETIKRKKS